MTNEQRLKNLTVPTGPVDAVIDTDAYNEIDDQFAISYLLRSKEKINTVALYAAPFSFPDIPPDVGMKKSYDEIKNLLKLLGEDKPVFSGSRSYLPDESTSVISEAAADLSDRAKKYSPENPLYIIAIGAITNIASAILTNPTIAENCVLIWLGGHSRDMEITDEYNMRQDIAAARVVMRSGIPLIQLPCAGVVHAFSISECELEKFFLGRTPVAEYLARHSLEAMAIHRGKCWTRTLWDVTAVGWLLNDGDKFMYSRIVPTRLPSYDFIYEEEIPQLPMRYVFYVCRDALMQDLIDKVCFSHLE